MTSEKEKKKWKVRRTTPRDFPAMTVIACDKTEVVTPGNNRASKKTVSDIRKADFENLSSFMKHPDTIGLVVYEEDSPKKLVAYCLIRFHFRDMFSGKQRTWLFDIAVDEDYQGQGIGSFLMDKIIEQSRWRGDEGLCLHVTEGNDVAKSLYEKYQLSVERFEMGCWYEN